jgi:D-alanine-D-alanine ligase
MVKEIRKIGVLNGGDSSEREISLRSGKNVLTGLKNLGYEVINIDPQSDPIPKDIDFAYITLHGKGGEDGTIQAILESKNIPYSGPGVLASALAMDKVMTKYVLLANHIPTANFQVIDIKTNLANINLKFPLILKPRQEGSSIGIEIIDSEIELKDKVKTALEKYPQIFIEEYLEGKELTVGVIGKDFLALPILELVPQNRFYDFEAKYTAGMTKFILPAPLDRATESKVINLAKKTFQVIGCKGVSRIDFILDKQNNPFVIEVNTSPGMTDQSDLPAQAKSAGISFEQLLQTIIDGSI